MIQRPLARVMGKTPGQLRSAIATRLILSHLRVRNQLSRSPILGDAAAVVCLTSFGSRARTVYLTIESIGRGTVRPRRIILWLDEAELLADIPAELRMLQRRGLEIVSCQNLGPHKKYFPYVESEPNDQLPLVIADDDVLYPTGWLRGLVDAYTNHPSVINGYRARVVGVEGDGLTPYREWRECTDTDPSYANFLTGVSGAMLPAGFLRGLRAAGTEFMNTCPLADDVWLHSQAVRQGYMIRQILDSVQDFRTVPGTQDQSLMHLNVDQGMADKQVHATYGAVEVARIGESLRQHAP